MIVLVSLEINVTNAVAEISVSRENVASRRRNLASNVNGAKPKSRATRAARKISASRIPKLKHRYLKSHHAAIRADAYLRFA